MNKTCELKKLIKDIVKEVLKEIKEEEDKKIREANAGLAGLLGGFKK